MMRIVCCLVLGVIVASPLWSQPPFHGTIFIDPDILNEDDPTTFVKLEFKGSENRRMFDWRVEAGWVVHRAHLFLADFDDGSTIEVQVNPEFSVQEAQVEAAKYLPAIGRIPRALRRQVETVWIHRGQHSFGGGNNNLLIHTDRGEDYLKQGILEEAFCHEAAHTSLDPDHAHAIRWTAAQATDGEFISRYAMENPGREDIAESFLVYLAVRCKPDRITNDVKETILETIDERLKYFDSLRLDLWPLRTVQWTVTDQQESSAAGRD